jgi:hypothetical protein
VVLCSTLQVVSSQESLIWSPVTRHGPFQCDVVKDSIVLINITMQSILQTDMEIAWNTGVEIPGTFTGLEIPRNTDWCADSPEHWLVCRFPGTLVCRTHGTLTGVEIPRNTDWCADFPEHWLVWRFPGTLTGVETPRNTDWCANSPEHWLMRRSRGPLTGVQIPGNTDWCGDTPNTDAGDSPEHSLVWRFPEHWFGDYPELWVVCRFPGTLTGEQIPRFIYWCGDSPEHWGCGSARNVTVWMFSVPLHWIIKFFYEAWNTECPGVICSWCHEFGIG